MPLGRHTTKQKKSKVPNSGGGVPVNDCCWLCSKNDSSDTSWLFPVVVLVWSHMSHCKNAAPITLWLWQPFPPSVLVETAVNGRDTRPISQERSFLKWMDGQTILYHGGSVVSVVREEDVFLENSLEKFRIHFSMNDGKLSWPRETETDPNHDTNTTIFHN